MKRIAVLSALALVLAGCGSDGGPSNPNNGESAFNITVGTGRNPTYSWSGGTGFQVSVVRVSAPGTIVWGIANTSMTIASPVTHGTVPGGSIASANTEATLTTGVAYRVNVTRNDQTSGFKEFTP